MANKKVGTIYGDTIQNSPVCGGGHHQVFTNSKGSKFTIEGDTIDNIVGPGKEQIIYQNGKRIGKIYNDTIQNSRVCGGGYQKIVEFEDGTKGRIYNDTVDNVRGGGKVQILELNNGKKYKIENDFIQNSSVCGGGYQKVVSECDKYDGLISDLIDYLRKRFKIFDIACDILGAAILIIVFVLLVLAII